MEGKVMKRQSLGQNKVNHGKFTPESTTPLLWNKPTGNRTTRIGGGYYNYRSHAYVRR